MLSIAIQAGGESRRIGQDKGLVPLAGRPLIEHLLDRVNGLGDEILITTNKPANYAYLDLRMFPDRKPGAGALGGLRTALEHARGTRVLVLACDMPFVNRNLLEHLITVDPDADAVVPRWKDRFQTMHAVYARETCLEAVQKALHGDQLRVTSFYAWVGVHAISESEVARWDPAGLSFFNVNSLQDLNEAEGLLRDGHIG